MTKKILQVFLILVIGYVGVSSCRKTINKNVDLTKNYFPIVMGQYVTYDVDSIYFLTTYDTTITGAPDTLCGQYEVKSQIKYSITDTARDVNDSIIYMVTAFYRHYDGDQWQAEGAVQYITVKPDSIIVTQDGNKYVKMQFPVVNGYNWYGNDQVDVNYPYNVYLNNWSYVYQNLGLSFNNDLHNFDKTVTVLEDDESINYPYVNTSLYGYRTYAKEVYAYNIGMVYKEWIHFTYTPGSTHCANGYTVVMRAVDYN